MPEGRQSPPPERQTGAQTGQPASGQGVEQINVDSKKGEQQDQLKVNHFLEQTSPAITAVTNSMGLQNLESNPKGALDDALASKFTKTEK